MHSYGEVRYRPDTKKWVIRTDPFVRARLKRVFARVPQAAADVVSISATTENSRELRWFLLRYPMNVDRMDLMDSLSAQHEHSEQRLASLMAGHVAPLSIQLAEPPREYQTFAAQMCELRKGLLLADDLGLGKTVSGICTMVLPGMLPALVVCDPHLQRQWERQLKRFAPSLRTVILKKGTPYDLAPKRRGKQIELIESPLPDVIISTYHKLKGWAETLAGQVKLVIFDECRLRNPDTDIYRGAIHVASAAEARLGLTATPIHNYGNEFFYVLNALCPDALGNYDEFQREWCHSVGGKYHLNDPLQFGDYLRRNGLMLRRTRKEVGRELPKASRIVHEIESDEKALEKLKGNAVELAKMILRQHEDQKGDRMRASGEFEAIVRQATGIAKAPYVIEFVKMLVDSGEQVVLYGWHHAVYGMWMEGLKEFNPVMYTGTESINQKDKAVEEFLSGRSRVLIMSLRSGAGVDGLQAVCSQAVFGEFDWSPAIHKQCFGRVDRDGQENPCTAWFLLSESGTDPFMAEVLGLKTEQSDGVMNPDAELVERIDTGDNSIQRLARSFLTKRGEALPALTTVSDITTVVDR